MVRRIIRIFAWSLAVLAVLMVGLYVYLRNADLTVYQPRIEAMVASSIGHELSIGGRFELNFGATTVVVVEDATLVNPDWPDDGELVRVGHLTFAFNTWSLFSHTFLVEELRARDVSGKLLRDESGRTNWVSERVQSKEPKESDGGTPDLTRIAFRSVSIEGVEFLYEDPARRRPVLAVIELLSISPDENEILDLDLRGDINDLPLWADGKVGPWRNFVDGRDIFADLNLTLGQGQLSVEGTVADMVRLEGMEVTGVLTGPEIERVLERLGVPQFTTGEYTVTAEVQQQNVGHFVRLNGDIGEIELYASGSTDSFPLPRSVSYDFSITGPDSGAIADLAGIDEVPAIPFQVSGEYTREQRVIGFNDALLRIGQNALGFSGNVDLENLDIDMTVTAEGPNFAVIDPFVGLDGLPAAPFTIRGQVQRQGAAWEANDVEARVGENRLAISGRVETGSDIESRIALQADGPDISILQDFTNLQGIPARPYDIDVVVRSHPDGILIEEGTGVFGENRVEAQGTVALRSGLDGTSGSVRMSGPDFQNVALISGVPHLPPGPFDISGEVAVRNSSVHLEGVVARVGEFQGEAAGTVTIRGDDAGRFELDVLLEGPDLGALPEVEGLEAFAGDPFRVAGNISRDGKTITATALDVSVGNLDATLNGVVEGAAEYVRMSVSANAEDSLIIRKIAKLNYLPGGPVIIDGSIEMSDNEIRFADTVMNIGDYRVGAHGALSLSPRSNDSDLVFAISGPSLHEVGRIGGLTTLADKDFGVSGEFEGTPTGFVMRDFVARVGDNDLRGEFDVNLEGKPNVVGALASTRLDLSDRFAQEAIPDLAEESPEDATDTDDDDGRLFSGEPLDTGRLQAANVNIEFQVDELIFNVATLTDVDVGVRLEDGALTVDPFFLREKDGSIEASFSLAPEEGQYRLRSRLEVDNVRAGMLAPGEDVTSLPPVGGTMQFEGVGGSIRTIMASSNGSLSFRQDAGKVREVFGSALFKDVLLQVLRRLNPLSRSRDYQLLECGIYDVSIEDGIATIDNFIIQTESMTTVASGEVNLRNEELEIAFRASPREGLGISLGTVANQLLELRGTLKSPRIGVDAGRTATTTGAAVATGGLSLLARGLWDRLSAASDVCEKTSGRKR